MTATNAWIRPGDTVIYTGSLTEFRGPVLYRKFCYCDDCDYSELRYTLIGEDGDGPAVLEHVRRTSFTAAPQNTPISDALAGEAYAIREEQAYWDDRCKRMNAGRLPHQFFSLNDSIRA